jgi:hypothetical protein
VAYLIPFYTALAFLTNMTEKCKSASPRAIQVKNKQKAVGIKKELDVISRLEKGEQIVDICRIVRLAHSSIHTIWNDAARIKESAKSGTDVFVCVARVGNEPYQKQWMWVSYFFIALERNKYVV